MTGSLQKRVFWSVVFFGTALFLLILANTLFIENQKVRVFTNDVLLVISGTLTTVCLGLAWRNSGKDRGRLSWGLLTFSLAIWTLGCLVYLIIETVWGRYPFFSVADVLYFFYYPVAMCAVLGLPANRLNTTERIIFHLDLGSAFLASVVMFAQFIIVPAWKVMDIQDPFSTILPLIFPVLDFFLVFMAAGILMRRTQQSQYSAPMAALLLGTCFLMLGNTNLAYDSLDKIYSSSGISDVSWALFIGFMGLAGLLQFRSAGEYREMSGRYNFARLFKTNIWVPLMPHVWLATAFGLMAWSMQHGLNMPLETFVSAGVCILCFVMLRQLLISWENQRLTLELHSHGEKLEQRIQERTEALGKSEQRFRNIISNTPNVAVEIFDADGRVLFWNPAAEKVFGVSRVAALGRTLDQLILTPEAGQEFVAILRSLLVSGGTHGPAEWACRTPSGEQRHVYSIIFPLEAEGEETSFVCMDVDITDFRRAEDSLRRGEQKYRDLVESANSIILRFAIDGTIHFMNSYGLQFFGYSEAELMGRNVMGTIVPEKETGTERDLSALLADIGRDPDKYRDNENENMKKGGERVWISWTNKAILDDDGNVSEVLSIGKDITKQREFEELFLQSQKMESIGRLAAGVAHDFNNLLSPILGFSEMLLDDLPADDRIRADVLQIHGAAERAKELTQRLLVFGRKQVVQFRSLDLREVILDFEKILQRTIRENIRLEFQMPETLGPVKADKGRLEQVIMNLAVNAQDAMPEGGVLEIAVKETTLDKGAVPYQMGMSPGKYALLSVSDTGCGMEAQTLDRLFEPFFTTKVTGKGTGLGLSTVYGIVNQHGGYVHAVSSPGEGSSFRIYLPVTEGDVAQEDSLSTVRRDVSFGTETVLVVEDNEMVRTMVCRMLERHGYYAVAAESAGECMAMVASMEEPADLLLTDVVMPEMNGKELYEKMRAVSPGIRVVYMSGYDGDIIARDGEIEDNVHFILKPFSGDALIHKIREALEK